MSFSSVQSALIAKWVAVNALLADGPLETAYPNTKFSPPASGVPWAQVFLLANQPFVGSLGSSGEDEMSGILQIDLHYPLGEGVFDLNAAYDVIRDNFKAGTYLTYSTQWVLINSCGMEPPMSEGAYYKGMITIEWETRLTR